MKLRIFLATLFVLGSYLVPLPVNAAIPHLINLESRLTDAKGNPIIAPTQVEFDLYQGGSATGAGSGTIVYQEIATITPASDGTFSYLFGSGSALNGTQLTSTEFNTTQPVYLQIDINNQTILPRLQIVSQAWALMAENVIDGAVTTAKLSAGAVTTPNISTGAVTTAQLDPSVSNYLVPSGAIMMFTNNCPSGWGRFSPLDNLFPMGSNSYGTTGGSATHSHTVNPHTHSISGTTSNASLTGSITTYNGNFQVTDGQYQIGLGSEASVFPPTSTSQHYHSINLTSGAASPGTDSQSNIPPYITVIWCQKQ